MTDTGGTEVRAAHRTELSFCLVRCLIILKRLLGVEGKVELVFPPELITSLRQGIVANSCSRMSLGYVSCMSGNLVCHHTGTHVVLVWQGEMLLRRDITEHGRAIPSYHRRTNG